jgi:hypothetical protein
VTIIKTTNGNIFGGYTERLWNPTGRKIDNSAFIFSLVNEKNQPFIAKAHSIYCLSNYGVNFEFNLGASNFVDYIGIPSDSNRNAESISDLGNIYQQRYGSKKTPYILAGTKEFKTVEIEVFLIC